ncbi:MAG: hypothetical protein WCK53_00640 [Methanomicrobiales archaeon]
MESVYLTRALCPSDQAVRDTPNDFILKLTNNCEWLSSQDIVLLNPAIDLRVPYIPLLFK